MAFFQNIANSAEVGVYGGVQGGVDSGVATVIRRGIVNSASTASNYISDKICKCKNNFNNDDEKKTQFNNNNEPKYRITINNHTNLNLIFKDSFNKNNEYKLGEINCLSNSSISKEWNAKKNFSFGAVYSIGDFNVNLYLMITLSSPFMGCDKINADFGFGKHNIKQLWKSMRSNQPISKQFILSNYNRKKISSSASSKKLNDYNLKIEAKFEQDILNSKNKVWTFDLYPFIL